MQAQDSSHSEEGERSHCNSDPYTVTWVIDHICRHHPVTVLKLLMQHSLNGSSLDVHNVVIKFDVVPIVFQLSVKGCKIACKQRTVPRLVWWVLSDGPIYADASPSKGLTT